MPKDDRPTLPPPADENRSREVGPPALDAVPWVMLSHAEITQLDLDHKEGFLLSLIDGRTSVETLLELASMPKRDVLRLLVRWTGMGIIILRENPGARGRSA